MISLWGCLPIAKRDKSASPTTLTRRDASLHRPATGLGPRLASLRVKFVGSPESVICPSARITPRTPFMVVVQSVLADLDGDVSLGILADSVKAAWRRPIVAHPMGDTEVLRWVIDKYGSSYSIEWA